VERIQVVERPADTLVGVAGMEVVAYTELEAALVLAAPPGVCNLVVEVCSWEAIVRHLVAQVVVPASAARFLPLGDHRPHQAVSSSGP
jgi:hypothetical protein